MARQRESTFLGSVKLFFESPLAMALVAIMAIFVTGELFVPLLFGPSPMGAGLAAIGQTLALVAMAAIGIHALAAELERMLSGLRHARPLEH
jgi:hypothetical protein